MSRSVVAAELLGLAAVIETVVRQPHAFAPYIVVLCLVGLATTVPIGLRQPNAAGLAVTAACVVSLSVFGTLTVAGGIAQVLAAYRLGRSGWPIAAVLVGAPYLTLTLSNPVLPQLLLVSLVPIAAATGIAQRVRREDAEAQAAQHAVAGSLLEHTARGERARIARELHDVVAHHISMIAVQSENARLTTPGMPPAGAQRLSAIGDTARSALTEMRRLLGVLREDAQTDGAARAERRPQPGLRQLTELLDEARDAAGTGTRFILRGAPTPLAPGVELAAYRIVQEALTNARRHAPGAAVDVELHFTGTDLRVLVRDNGPGPPEAATRPGHGLLGMRERATAVGGRFQAGAGRTGGFIVEAILPSATEDER